MSKVKSQKSNAVPAAKAAALAWVHDRIGGWYARAIRSRIKPLKRFARQFKEKIDGVLAHCQHPLHTSLLEGMNNKIKVIKKMACGYRDEEYFFLKIRSGFPGIRG